MLEGAYKTALTKRLYKRWEHKSQLVVVRLDAMLMQGIPDMLLLFDGGFFAALEGKTSATAKIQPNQPYYVDVLDRLCFSAFIYPENEEAVLNELEQALQSHWATRVS